METRRCQEGDGRAHRGYGGMMRIVCEEEGRLGFIGRERVLRVVFSLSCLLMLLLFAYISL